MSDVVEPIVRPKAQPADPRLLPPYHVVLENDDFHTFDFVIAVLREVFGFPSVKAQSLAMEAHRQGESIVWTGPKEVAELKIEQVTTFSETHPTSGQRLGPLSVRLEPAR